MSTGEALAGALEYLAAGYAVGPVTLELDGKGKKRARFHTDWQRDPAGITRDRAQVEEWAREYPECGWHAPCGPNGFVVVDGDVKRGTNGLKIADGVKSWTRAKAPTSPMTATTQSGGRHWYFRAPAEPIRNSASAVEGVPHVDVRGEGGTVFITGTEVHGGGLYVADRVLPAAELPELPEQWAERLRKAGPRKGRPASSSAPARPASRLVSGGSVHERGWIEDAVEGALKELVRHGESDFRKHLFEAAAIGYRAVDCGVLEADELGSRLREAIADVWGGRPDDDDLRWIREGRDKAAGDPWRVAVERVPDRDDVADEDEDDDEDDDVPASWAPVDLGPFLDGTHVTPAAAFLEREDGVALFYPGLVHWVYGESESGKSWVCQVATARVLAAGGTALFVDYESDPGAVIGRLLALGAPTDAIRERFTYVRPESSCADEPVAFRALLRGSYEFAVVDGVTMGLGIEGGTTNDTDDAAAWVKRIPQRIARRTGAAVACVDHVTKDKDGRGRFPIGSQAKLAALDGAGYLVEPKTAIRPGAVGEIELRVGKDRPGGVRAHAGEYRASDRTQQAAMVTIDATDPDAITVAVAAPKGEEAGAGKFKPTVYMERVSLFLSTTEGEASTKTIEQSVEGRADMIRTALDELALLGYVKRRTGARNAVLYTHVRRYTDLQREVRGEVLSDDEDLEDGFDD